MEKYIIAGAMSRKQIAAKYKISGKALNTRLRRHGLDFGKDRALLPYQIEKIIEVIGLWQIEVDD